MRVITLCVGSSCYLRGAHKIAEVIEEFIVSHDLALQVELQGHFCHNRCLEGVAANLDGRPLPRLTPANAAGILAEHILQEA